VIEYDDVVNHVMLFWGIVCCILSLIVAVFAGAFGLVLALIFLVAGACIDGIIQAIRKWR